MNLSAEEEVLHLIASGVIRLAEGSTPGISLTVPYPPALQMGLDRLVLACIRRGTAPVQGVPDLLAWCRRPLATWPLDLGPDTVGLDDRLLIGTRPTQVCDEWAVEAGDVIADREETVLLHAVLTACRLADRPQDYVAFRRWLIEHPVVTALELQQARATEALALLAEHLRSAYTDAPVECESEGVFRLCPDCGNLLWPTVGNAWVCDDSRCRPAPEQSLSRISARGGVLWLKRGIRRYVAAPGRAELDLLRRLQGRGLLVDLWPAYDAYDLRIQFPNGEVWAVDMKDWSNPVRLASRVKPIPDNPPWARAYFVFPDVRKDERPDYVRAFKARCRVLRTAPPIVGAMFATHFVSQVTRRMKEIGHA